MYFNIDYNNDTTIHSSSHFHTYYEICFFEAGNRTYLIGEDYYEIFPNCVTLIKPYVQHSTKGSSHASRTVIYFTEDFLREHFTEKLVLELISCFDETVKRLNEKSYIKRNVEKLQEANANNNKAECALLLAQLLLTLRSESPLNSHNGNSNFLIPSIIVYINDNLCMINDVKGIADNFHISVSYLAAIFKNTIGIPIKQYIINMRINTACKELVTTNKSISAITKDCGFNSSTHFSNSFRQHMNMTPKEYRRLNKNKS